MVNKSHGFSDWAWQRISAGVMLLLIVLLLVRLVVDAPVFDQQHDAAIWQAWCQPWWFRASALIFAWALIYHAWIGVKEITMDYLHHPVVRARVEQVCAVLSGLYALVMLIIVWNFS